MIKVLFVCLGNICRSPMAEAVFMHHVRRAGLEGAVTADSAGTGHWHVGESPHTGTRRVLAANSIPCDHRARLVSVCDLDDYDYVITMDEDNLRDVRALGAGRARLAPLMAFAPDAGVAEVPDPYYTGAFEPVYELVDRATRGLLGAIREEHGL